MYPKGSRGHHKFLTRHYKCYLIIQQHTHEMDGINFLYGV